MFALILGLTVYQQVILHKAALTQLPSSSLTFTSNCAERFKFRVADSSSSRPQGFGYRKEVYGADQLLLGRLSQQIKNHQATKKNYDSAVFCACAKCGSTSLYQYLYKNIFGVDYEEKYNYTKPYLQTVRSPRWNGVFNQTMMSDRDLVNAVTNSSIFSFAVVREPAERLLSAWKSKLACNHIKFKTDVSSRERLTLHLLKLAEIPSPNSATETGLCLPFSTYLGLLYGIHILNKTSELDAHFMPQHLQCFRHTEPSRWTHVVKISDPEIGNILSQALGLNNNSNNRTLNRAHVSPDRKVVTEKERALLELITLEERQLLAKYINAYG